MINIPSKYYLEMEVKYTGDNQLYPLVKEFSNEDLAVLAFVRYKQDNKVDEVTVKGFYKLAATEIEFPLIIDKEPQEKV